MRFWRKKPPAPIRPADFEPKFARIAEDLRADAYQCAAIDRVDGRLIVSMSPRHVATVITPYGTITGWDLGELLNDFFRHEPTHAERARAWWRGLWPCYTGYSDRGVCARGGIGCPRPHPVVRIRKALRLS